MGKNRVVQFAVGTPAQPLSSVWTVSRAGNATKSDVYLAASHFGRHAKISLHQDRGRERNQHVRFETKYFAETDTGRAGKLLKWDPIYLSPGYERALDVFIFTGDGSAALPIPTDVRAEKLKWVEPPPKDACVVVSVALVNPEWAAYYTGCEGNYAELLAREHLPSGRRLEVSVCHKRPPNALLRHIEDGRRGVSERERNRLASELNARGYWMGLAPERFGVIAEVPLVGDLFARDFERPWVGGMLGIAVPDRLMRGLRLDGYAHDILAHLVNVRGTIYLEFSTSGNADSASDREKRWRETLFALRAAQLYGFVALNEVGQAASSDMPARIEAAITINGLAYVSMQMPHAIRTLPPLDTGSGEPRLNVRVRSGSESRCEALLSDRRHELGEWLVGEPDWSAMPYAAPGVPSPHLRVQTEAGEVLVEAIDLNTRLLSPDPYHRAEIQHDRFTVAAHGRVFN